jgi:acyl-CoA hydrolase
VDHVVTEHGVARLRGKTVRERAQELISISHPDFRAGLTDQARKLGYL